MNDRYSSATLSQKGAVPLVRRLHSKAEVLSYLDRQRIYSASAIGRLEPGLFKKSDWLLAKSDGQYALCLRGRGIGIDTLFTLGSEAALAEIFSFEPCPERAYITCELQHQGVIKARYHLESQQVMLRMVVTTTEFVPAPGEVARLGGGDVHELNRLYREDGGIIFSSYHLDEGVYYGIWHDHRLVAVAGTLMISPIYRLAIVGNVLTHPRYRNQGFATICTSAVTQELLKTCSEVVLNVEVGNAPAIRAYTKLGYRENCCLIEALGIHRSAWKLETIVHPIFEKLRAFFS